MARDEAFAPFRYPNFRRYQAIAGLLNLAVQVQGIAVAWQVYSLTRQPLDLGLVGLFQFIPICALALPAGHAADRFNRKLILVLCTILLTACATALALFSMFENRNVRLVYVVLFLIGCARAFYGPASSTILPAVVPKDKLPSAVGWATSIWQITTICGPPLGGVLYAITNRAMHVYFASAAMFLLVIFFQLRLELPARAVAAANNTLQSLLAGVSYLIKSPVLLGAVTVDLFAVLLGGAVALLPVYARDILHIDSDGLGLLRGAPAAGAAIVAIALALHPLQRRAGIVMLICVGIFGLTTIVFGVSRSLPLSLAMLFIGGAVDMVSVFVRQNLRQLLTPDHMRGRVGAVTGLFVSISNELGEFESGLMAHWFGTEQSVVIGGAGTIVVVVLWFFLFPKLRKVDRLLDQVPESQAS